MDSPLLRLRYSRKSERNRLRLEPKPGFDGLEPVTLARTPSEYRGIRTMQAQIRETLGLKRLGKP